MNIRVGAIAALAILSPCAGRCETPDALYRGGHFEEAQAAGIAQNDTDGWALAARAALAEEAMRDQPCLDCIRHIEDIARHVIASDARRPEGHIYLAAAMGYEARIIGDLAAQSKGYVDRAKHELDAAVAGSPNDAWALAALGSWHIEVARDAGPTLARWLFGASFARGQDYYAKAFAASPDNLVLHYQYAVALAAYDASAYRAVIESELARAIAGTPSSVYENFARTRARELLEAVEHGDATAIERIIRRDQGYPA